MSITKLLGMCQDGQLGFAIGRIQYVEILVSRKTNQRILSLINCMLYIKYLILIYPQGNNSDSWLFISLIVVVIASYLMMDNFLRKIKINTW